jgi:hypothetical protein
MKFSRFIVFFIRALREVNIILGFLNGMDSSWEKDLSVLFILFEGMQIEACMS